MSFTLLKDEGFTFVELTASLSILTILLGIAVLNVQNISYSSVNALAESDYRNAKVVVKQAIAEATGEARFIFRNRTGPAGFPEPLLALKLSPDVRATIVHNTRIRNNRRPLTNTRIEVAHLEGSITYRYTEINGRIVEQKIER